MEDIHLPPEELDTQAFVLTMSEAAVEELGLVGAERGAAWRGVGRLIRRVAPLFLRCQPSDLGLATEVRSPHFRRPAIYVWDRVMGGVGLGDLLFEAHREVFEAAREVVAACECAGGCPVCVGPPHESGRRGKETARAVLAHLASGVELVEADPELDPEAGGEEA
jgi:DEAD/DEAH box helicase domain-containing protein